MPAAIIGKALRGRRAGADKLAWNNPATQTEATFTLTSPAFAEGQPIPKRYAAAGENTSPPLRWADAPTEAAEFVLIVEDPDAPTRRPIVHSVAHVSAPNGELPEGALDANTNTSGVRIARGSMRRRGYTGPRPIPGHGPHHYVFQLFALDSRIDSPATSSPTTLVETMAGHVIARARLTGTYELP
jgi:Raf kinase inhibitor-like YbhB/YbcL family protein